MFSAHKKFSCQLRINMEFVLSVMRFALLVAVTSCSKTSRLTNPKPCCTATEQFEMSLGIIVGQVFDGEAAAMIEQSRGAYDFKGRRYGMEITVRQSGETVLQYRTILLYKKGKAYFIEDGVCVEGSLSGFEPIRCVPEFANYTDSFYLGNNDLLVDNWHMALKPTASLPLEGDLSITTSREDCIPVSSTFVGSQNGPGSQKAYATVTGGFMNFTSGITDPDYWFVPPAGCMNPTLLRSDSSWSPMQHWKRMQALNWIL